MTKERNKGKHKGGSGSFASKGLERERQGACATLRPFQLPALLTDSARRNDGREDVHPLRRRCALAALSNLAVLESPPRRVDTEDVEEDLGLARHDRLE